ncbi:hypothetical protein B566_EDAN014197 [Ephemera danica]|nr:hypothetical protein B566_EDAN014197 [Ephemera danica]
MEENCVIFWMKFFVVMFIYQLHKFLGDQPMIFFIAASLHLFIEAPVLNMLRHFFRENGPAVKEESEIITPTNAAADDSVIEVGKTETEEKTQL